MPAEQDCSLLNLSAVLWAKFNKTYDGRSELGGNPKKRICTQPPLPQTSKTAFYRTKIGKPISALLLFFTSVRLLPLRSSVLSRAQFSRPSTLVRWLCEQSRWRSVYTSLSPLVLISWLWSTDNLCSLFMDSSPATVTGQKKKEK